LTLDAYISKNYDHLKKLARNIARNEEWYEDLLHESIISAITSKHIDNLLQNDEFEFYLIRVMYLSVNSPSAPFNKQYIQYKKNKRDYVEKVFEEDKTWLGSRLVNEQLDILISRLSEFERLIFEEYILEDFSYKEFSKQTGIPSVYLYRTIDKIKQKLKQNVIR
jgi:RNA polymerase sigma factor (sigma-70 family)